MKDKIAIATLAVASAFSGAANAHGPYDPHHRHGPHYDPYPPRYEPYVPPVVVLPVPPPVYQAPPVYVAPPVRHRRDPMIYCQDVEQYDRNGYPYPDGSLRTFEDRYDRTYDVHDPRPCP